MSLGKNFSTSLAEGFRAEETEGEEEDGMVSLMVVKEALGKGSHAAQVGGGWRTWVDFLHEVKGDSVALVVQQATWAGERVVPLHCAKWAGPEDFLKVLQCYLSTVSVAGQVWGALCSQPLADWLQPPIGNPVLLVSSLDTEQELPDSVRKAIVRRKKKRRRNI